MKKTCVLSALFFVLIHSAIAQNAKTIEKIAAYTEKLYSYGCFNGNLLLGDSTGILMEKSLGYADYGKKELLDANCRFEIASLTKAITATAVMQLMEQGKIRLEDSLRMFIPELPYHGITIRHLLHHTSGLPDYVGLFYNYLNQQKRAVNSDIIAMLVRFMPPLLNPPGKVWHYSNTGYCMLSLVIEKVSGQSYAEYVQKHILEPCDMKQTYLYSVKGYADKFFLAKPYFFSNRHKTTLTTDSMPQASLLKAMDGITGDARVFSTCTDLYKFCRMLAAGHLISAENRSRVFEAAMTSEGKNTHYGMGWYTDKDEKSAWVYHPGIFPGYRAYWGMDLKKGTVLILLGNNEQVNDRIVEYAGSIRRILAGKKPLKVKKNPEGMKMLKR